MNFYEILGIPENATEKEIKKSYKALVKRYHPDVFQGDKNLAENKIKELNEAYETLSNRESRYLYDTSLHPEPVIEISFDDSSTKSNISNFNSYGDWYKNDLYDRAHRKYTTNFYGVSRNDLKQEKNKSYSNYTKSSSTVDNLYKTRLMFIIFITIILLLVLLIFLLSVIQKKISSFTTIINSTDYFEDTSVDNMPFIELDLSFHDVTVLLGSPDYTETKENKMYAYYDNSYIVFDSRNRVVDWKNNGAFNSETYTGEEYKLLEKIYNSVNDYWLHF